MKIEQEKTTLSMMKTFSVAVPTMAELKKSKTVVGGADPQEQSAGVRRASFGLRRPSTVAFGVPRSDVHPPPVGRDDPPGSQVQEDHSDFLRVFGVKLTVIEDVVEDMVQLLSDPGQEEVVLLRRTSNFGGGGGPSRSPHERQESSLSPRDVFQQDSAVGELMGEQQELHREYSRSVFDSKLVRIENIVEHLLEVVDPGIVVVTK